jgi:glycosyltransferase involved in cell wall biosynthesis
VLGQRYPSVEYVIVDGGSSDGSAEIIERHADRLAYWCSEPDAGHGDGLNKGFAHTTGDVMAWLNSDDKYVSGAFSVVGQIFAAFPEVEWLSSVYPLAWNRFGEAVFWEDAGGFSRPSFFGRATLPSARWYSRSFVQQESTFWRRSLWERAGGRVDTSLALAADFELWARFYQHAELHGVAAFLGGFRVHSDQRTSGRRDEYVAEAESILRRYGGAPPGRLGGTARRMARRLTRGCSLRQSGTLATRGLARLSVANPARTFVWVDDDWRLVPHVVI